MKLKVIPILCAAVLLTTTTVHADTTINESDLVDNSKDVDVKVTAEVSSTFTVSLPSDIELTQGETNYTYSGSVGVKGDIDSGHNVLVVPSADVTMHDVTDRPEGVLEYEGYTHKDPISGTVSQLETAWNYTILSSGASSGNFNYNSETQYYNTSLTITTPSLSAGDWEGTLTYNISLVSTIQPVQQAVAGFYDADDNLLATWEESGIDVSKNYTYTNYVSDTTATGYTVIKKYPKTKKVVIPYGITNICDYVFADCTGLTSITIPNSVTSIGEGAFFNCDNLTSLTIPDSVTSIGDSAFLGCNGLTSVTIPDSVTSIDIAAFQQCTSLTSVTIPNSVTTIGKHAFNSCTGLTSVTIQSGVTSIGEQAFAECTSLTSVTIPNSVTSIGESAFYDCYRLTSVTIPDSVTSIGYNAFKYVQQIYYSGSASGSPWGAYEIN